MRDKASSPTFAKVAARKAVLQAVVMQVLALLITAGAVASAAVTMPKLCWSRLWAGVIDRRTGLLPNTHWQAGQDLNQR